MTDKLSEAGELRDKLTDSLAEAAELIMEGVEIAEKLAACFEGNADYTDEHKQALRWKELLMYNSIIGMMEELEEDEGDGKPADEQTVVLVLPKAKMAEVLKASQLSSQLEIEDIDGDLLDQAIAEMLTVMA